MDMTPQTIRKRADDLKGQKHQWNIHWQEISDYMAPEVEPFTTTRTSGEKVGQQILNNTAMISGELLAGELHSSLTNPVTYWLGIKTGNKVLDQAPSTAKALQTISNILIDQLANTNYYTEQHDFYMNEVFFGTGGMFIEDSEDEFAVFHSMPLSSFDFVENADGDAKELYRYFSWTAQQLKEKFFNNLEGKELEEALGEKVYKKYLSGDMDTKYHVVHAVYPDPKSKDKYLSKYVLCYDTQDTSNKLDKFLKEGSYKEKPFYIVRWKKRSNEKWGRGPGMTALPEVKMVNLMAKITIKGAQKQVDPPVQAPDDGFINPKVIKPGSMLYYRAGSNDRIEAVFKDTRVDIGIELENKRETRIREAFYVDQLKLREADRMTAAEVDRRRQDANKILAPVLSRHGRDGLVHLVKRIMGIANRKGLFEEVSMPGADEKGKAKFIPYYMSAMARAQEVESGNNMLRAFNAIAPIAAIDQTVTDIVDAMKAARFVWNSYGAPADVLATDDDIQMKKEQRQMAQEQMLQQQQQMQQAEVQDKQAGAASKIMGAAGGRQ